MQIIIRRTVVRHTRILKALAIGILVSGISFQATETPTLPRIVAATFPKATRLSSNDTAAYRVLFQAQSQGNWEKADEALMQVQDQRLMGTVLASRYLDNRYTATQDELLAWLGNYGDQPQAERIAALAKRKGIGESSIASVVDSDAIQGIGRVDTMGSKDMPSPWYRGLALWKSKDIDGALAQFRKAGETERLTAWQRSAIAFWQYRALHTLNRSEEAQAALAEAASYPRTFYGMIAQQTNRRPLALTAMPPYVPDNLRANASVKRAMALSQIGEYSEAERELRHLYKQLPQADRAGLVTIASELGLPNLQVRLGQVAKLNEEENIFASYPMPQWLAEDEMSIDNALMFAISRQESSFATEVKSQAGATGLMQLMPATANYIWQKSSDSLLASLDNDAIPESTKRIAQSDLHDPKTNMLLGQEYVRYLMGKSSADANLIHVLASYNAGPGMVAVWNRSAGTIEDPLLYVESIPYKETRNYVMQVMSNYWAYQSLMGKDTASLAQLAAGRWPTLRQVSR